MIKLTSLCGIIGKPFHKRNTFPIPEEIDSCYRRIEKTMSSIQSDISGYLENTCRRYGRKSADMSYSIGLTYLTGVTLKDGSVFVSDVCGETPSLYELTLPCQIEVMNAVKDVVKDMSPRTTCEDPGLSCMTSVSPEKTGLKRRVWISGGNDDRMPGVWVDMYGGDMMYIEIETGVVHDHDKYEINKMDLEEIFGWIGLNREILLDYWYHSRTGETDSADVIGKIKKLQK